MTRYIFVTGGVLSSLGKGISAASIGALLESRGFKIHIRKFEPYLNVDPGTMSPFQHGEVYVTDDGAETDLDLGHYERFTTITTTKFDAVSTGQIYSQVIAKERKGDYLGATIQVIPHITDAIQEAVTRGVDPSVDFMICEIGGTVGDIESLPFIEAFRQFANKVGRQQVLFVHLTLVPFVKSAAELKTKPSQHSVKELQSMGIQPDILLCRSEQPLPEDARQKLALFCNIKEDCVIEALDVDTIYQVPISYAEQKLDDQICHHFGIPDPGASKLKDWKAIVAKVRDPKAHVKIAVVGKYTGLQDAYKSLDEAIRHAGIALETAVDVTWLNAEELETEGAEEMLSQFHAILVPGGYGERGMLGKLKAVTYARTHKVPYMGICLGMQLAVIEFARNCAGMPEATSSEMDENAKEPVVALITEWMKEGVQQNRRHDDEKGGTMRLGLYKAKVEKGTLAHKVYGKRDIEERHRHRYEVNPIYKDILEKAGMTFAAMCQDGNLPEIVEVKDHPWFLAMQFHPEFKSRPRKPHPVFVGFVQAALEHQSS